MADSHDHLARIRAAVGIIEAAGAEVLIHAGDFIAPFSVKELFEFSGEVYGVFGNNDGEIAGVRSIWKRVYFGPYLFEIGGLRILVSHTEEDLARAPYDGIDVRIFGHSHKAVIRAGRPLDINPGAVSGILAEKPTCAILDTETLEAEIMEVG